ncbi:hypothetical protein [Brevibacillus halotolerans]|uniref:hypothetical protein n=1 Tax=Brevibacillus halotolerans TaxID=1507437 RepID=UPI0015EFCD2C|nr:hypothetical protein [Brevibacillus halotolerans]MBA4533801.1 hypothetical protein [Brevibacillus halotolerans]
MGSTAKMFAFFIALAFLMALFRDMYIVTYAKEDFRSSAIAAARQAIIKHQDWAALRTGDPPYLMKDGLEKTIRRVVLNNLNVGAKKIDVRMYAQSTPAMLSISMDADYSSTLLKLLKQDDKVNVPVATVEIIESKYKEYNY